MLESLSKREEPECLQEAAECIPCTAPGGEKSHAFLREHLPWSLEEDSQDFGFLVIKQTSSETLRWWKGALQGPRKTLAKSSLKSFKPLKRCNEYIQCQPVTIGSYFMQWRNWKEIIVAYLKNNSYNLMKVFRKSLAFNRRAAERVRGLQHRPPLLVPCYFTKFHCFLSQDFTCPFSVFLQW